MEKKSKNGITEQNIAPMIKKLAICRADDHVLRITARVCCQNPSLNPAQLTADFSKSARVNLYDVNEHIFR